MYIYAYIYVHAKNLPRHVMVRKAGARKGILKPFRAWAPHVHFIIMFPGLLTELARF